MVRETGGPRGIARSLSAGADRRWPLAVPVRVVPVTGRRRRPLPTSGPRVYASSRHSAWLFRVRMVIGPASIQR